jgi:hypothetical protein
LLDPPDRRDGEGGTAGTEVASMEAEWCRCACGPEERDGAARRRSGRGGGGETWKGRGRDARSLEVGERRLEENAWIGFSHPAAWTSKQRGSLARAQVSGWASGPGKTLGSPRGLRFPNEPLLSPFAPPLIVAPLYSPPTRGAGWLRLRLRAPDGP